MFGKAVGAYMLDTISFPRLDKLTPTLESTSLKLMEEAGEFAQLVGKFRRMSGEQSSPFTQEELAAMITAELFDVAQTVVTNAYILQDEYSVDLHQVWLEHLEKLVNKRYLSEEKAKEIVGENVDYH